jgi:hypothetical protein
MNFFKCLFFLFALFLTQSIFAKCDPEIHGAFESNLSDPPYTICATHKDFEGSKCIMDVYTMEKNPTTGIFTLFAKTTGSECQAVTQLNKPKQYTCTTDVCPATDSDQCPDTYQKGMYNGQLSCVKIKDDTLQCTDDVCYNPQNLKCPTDYSRGSFNGQSVCTRSTQPQEDENSFDDTLEGNINKARVGISNTVKGLTGTIAVKLDRLNQTIQELTEKLTKSNCNNPDSENTTSGVDCNPDSSGGDGDNNNTGGGSVDTSGLNADVPYIDNTNVPTSFDTSLFDSNSSCPSNNTLSMDFMGRSFSYTFEYQNICNWLEVFGYLILAFAYMYAANIVVKA